MVYNLVFDTETDGCRKPNGKWTNKQHIVELSWIVYNNEFNIIDKQHKFINDVADKIDPSNTVLNHDMNYYKNNGDNFVNVFSEFVNVLKTINGNIYAHNSLFDITVLLFCSEIKHINTDEFKKYIRKTICTCKTSINYCKINNKYGYKYPKMTELYEKLYNKKLNQKHNALDDCSDLIKCVKKGTEIGLWKLVDDKNK